MTILSLRALGTEALDRLSEMPKTEHSRCLKELKQSSFLSQFSCVQYFLWQIWFDMRFGGLVAVTLLALSVLCPKTWKDVCDHWWCVYLQTRHHYILCCVLWHLGRPALPLLTHLVLPWLLLLWEQLLLSQPQGQSIAATCRHRYPHNLWRCPLELTR